MTDLLINLDPEKREKIINAAMGEFALRGYEKASTNIIVKEAGISKGLLFHYFKSKKQLFLYLFDFVLNIMQHEFTKRIDFEERELFKKMRKISDAKLDLQKKYPQLFSFILGAYMEPAPEVRKDLEGRNATALSFNMSMLFQNIDTSMLREDIDLAEALNIISWTIEGMVNDEIKKCKVLKQEVDYNILFVKAEKYFALFEKLFYKGGQKK